jgi:hypothetical protein
MVFLFMSNRIQKFVLLNTLMINFDWHFLTVNSFSIVSFLLIIIFLLIPPEFAALPVAYLFLGNADIKIWRIVLMFSQIYKTHSAVVMFLSMLYFELKILMLALFLSVAILFNVWYVCVPFPYKCIFMISNIFVYTYKHLHNYVLCNFRWNWLKIARKQIVLINRLQKKSVGIGSIV